VCFSDHGRCDNSKRGRFAWREHILALKSLSAIDIAVVLPALASQVLYVHRLKSPLGFWSVLRLKVNHLLKYNHVVLDAEVILEPFDECYGSDAQWYWAGGIY